MKRKSTIRKMQPLTREYYHHLQPLAGIMRSFENWGRRLDEYEAFARAADKAMNHYREENEKLKTKLSEAENLLVLARAQGFVFDKQNVSKEQTSMFEVEA